ncbi:MAG: NAD(P)/FAD-dependent oxidoreductase [Bacteriovorax sp.]|nr:NAD(P)/FAD-dependent oxidoreductase [Bacteriovorax sp.]
MAKYDCVIIGAGMSGLAAGIRLSMYNKKVVILERHTITGGLNSYYSRGKRKFDVGLHALTNFVDPTERGRPFNKLMKQLRIPYDDFKLHPQNYSVIQFPDKKIKFTNDIDFLTEEIRLNFPHEIDGFMSLLNQMQQVNEVDLSNELIMAREVVRNYLKDESLIEVLFCPLLIYGSAWENDMDFSQFVIMFKSIFIEGFSRPAGGVRTIIDLLLKRFEECGGELRFKSEVTKIIAIDQKIKAVEINGEQIIECDNILSSMGLPETLSVLEENNHSKTKPLPRVGNLSFTESIVITDKLPRDLGIDATIIFYNNRPNYLYQKPSTLIDSQSAVVCFPNNFLYGNTPSDYTEGVMRVTNIANYDLWNDQLLFSKENYKDQKINVFNQSLQILKNVGLGSNGKSFEVLFKDVFTPTTIKRYTGHFGGTVYGSIDKSRNGQTDINGLYICGTDQGFLGIVGSMLSGISMANLHILSSSL